MMMRGYFPHHRQSLLASASYMLRIEKRQPGFVRVAAEIILSLSVVSLL